MNVNGVGRQSYFGKTEKKAADRKNGGGGFYESLSENINDRNAAGTKRENSAAAKNHVINTAYPYHNMPSAAGRYENDKANTGAVSEIDARNITYQESDYAKAYTQEGFTLMAQINGKERSVYIERRQEDGTVAGFVVNIDKVDANTTDPVEQTALKAWQEKADKTETEDGTEEALTVEEALLQFYEFIEDRIKNGPPKFLIGATELSVAEWDKLLESVDGQIDDIKEEMRERIEKLKEQQLKEQTAAEGHKNSTASGDAEDEREEEIEEELLESLFQEKSF